MSAILENLAITVLYWPSMHTVVREMQFGSNGVVSESYALKASFEGAVKSIGRSLLISALSS